MAIEYNSPVVCIHTKLDALINKSKTKIKTRVYLVDSHITCSSHGSLSLCLIFHSPCPSPMPLHKRTPQDIQLQISPQGLATLTTTTNTTRPRVSRRQTAPSRSASASSSSLSSTEELNSTRLQLHHPYHQNSKYSGRPVPSDPSTITTSSKSNRISEIDSQISLTIQLLEAVRSVLLKPVFLTIYPCHVASSTCKDRRSRTPRFCHATRQRHRSES